MTRLLSLNYGQNNYGCKRLEMYDTDYCENVEQVEKVLDRFSEARIYNFPSVESVQAIFKQNYPILRFTHFRGDTEELVKKYFKNDEIYDCKEGVMGKVQVLILPNLPITYEVMVERTHPHHLKVHISINSNRSGRFTVFEIESSPQTFLKFYISKNSKLAITGDKRVFCFDIPKIFGKLFKN